MVRVELNGIQIKFLKKMLEIEDGQEAMQKFAEIMREERLDVTTMPKVIDHCIKKFQERLKK
jgi:hypothetical protein